MTQKPQKILAFESVFEDSLITIINNIHQLEVMLYDLNNMDYGQSNNSHVFDAMESLHKQVKEFEDELGRVFYLACNPELFPIKKERENETVDTC